MSLRLPLRAAAFPSLSLCLLAFLLQLFCLFPWTAVAAQSQPPLSQASDYSSGLDLRDYWVSEKLDGVRGYWDGATLRFRSGTPIQAPEWFTAALPARAIDGELWLGRQRFDEVSGLLRRAQPRDEDWRQVKFMAFDLPHSALRFDARLSALQELVSQAGVPWLQVIPQFRVADEAALYRELERVVARGGEGLILHKGSSRYHAQPSDDLLKLKATQEGEALVIDHLPGQGRLAGLMGALLVETPEGRRFRLGTGFTDAERRQPPAKGSRVRYRHTGLTSTGLPRFARFVGLLEQR